jgi:putative flippase GtrA
MTKIKELTCRSNFWKFVSFCFVGGIAFLIDFAVFNTSAYFLGNAPLMPQLSRVLGIAISMIWNFSMNRSMTFKAKEGKIKSQLAKWLIVYGVTSVINIIIFSIMIGIIGNSFWDRNIAFVLGTGITLVLNFIGSFFWTFKKEEN